MLQRRVDQRYVNAIICCCGLLISVSGMAQDSVQRRSVDRVYEKLLFSEYADEGERDALRTKLGGVVAADGTDYGRTLLLVEQSRIDWAKDQEVAFATLERAESALDNIDDFDDRQFAAAQLHFRRGWWLDEVGDAKSGIQEYEQALGLTVDSPRLRDTLFHTAVLTNLGYGLLRSGRGAEALPAYLQILRKCRDNVVDCSRVDHFFWVNTLGAISKVHSYFGQDENAKYYLEQQYAHIIKYRPEAFLPLEDILLAKIQFQNRDLQSAERTLNIAKLKGIPEWYRPEAYILNLELTHAQGQTARALDMGAEVVALIDKNEAGQDFVLFPYRRALFFLTYGRIQRIAGETHDAIRTFERAYDIVETTDAWSMRAEISDELVRAFDAIEEPEMAIKYREIYAKNLAAHERHRLIATMGQELAGAEMHLERQKILADQDRMAAALAEQKLYTTIVVIVSLGLILVIGLIYRLVRYRKQAIDRLAEDNARKTALFRYVHHDIANLTLALQWSIESIRSRFDGDRDELARIQKPVNLLGGLIEDLRGLYDTRVIKTPPRELSKIVPDSVDMHRSLAESRDVRIVCETTETAHSTLHSKSIERILANLLGNAIKMSSPGQTIRVQAVDHQSGFTIEVKDQGTGMSNEDLQAFIAAASMPDKHTGYGLAIVGELVREMGGSIRSRLREAGGTIITVVLNESSANIPTDLEIASGPGVIRTGNEDRALHL